MKIEEQPLKFTEYFDLKVNQDELDFLDIYADQDIPLFLDPFGISAIGNKWSEECENQIATYFQLLVDSIKTGDRKTISKLLSALHEVKEIGLGYSMNSSNGRGIGLVQAREIQSAFEHSEAAKSGDIQDIADCALLIPGINRDKISDITANILKKQLIEFTKQQCDLYSIPTKRVPISAFDFNKLSFISFFCQLPVVNGEPKILLPINSVRHSPELSKDRYYRNFVLEFLKAEHMHPGDSLSYVLKNGTVKVLIKDLKEKYPMDTKFLYEFNKENPKILEDYKEQLRKTANKTNQKTKLKLNRKILTGSERAEILKDIKKGNDEASRFHSFSFDNLIFIFADRLSNPKTEQTINDGRKRIDIVFDNNDRSGFFNRLNVFHRIKCPKIFIECKNYGKEIVNPEVDQLLGRFSNRRGEFGILLCRDVADKKLLLKRCQDVLHSERGFIIVLEDSDILQLLKFKDNKKEIEIDNYMSGKFDELIM